MRPKTDISQSAPTRRTQPAISKKSSSRKERPAEPLPIPKQSAPSSSRVARGKSYGHVHASGNSQVHLGDHHHHYHFQAATSMYDFEPGTAVDGDILQSLLSYASGISDIAHRMMAANNASGVALDPEVLDQIGESDASVHDFTEDEGGLSEDDDEKGNGPFDLEDIEGVLPLTKSRTGTETSYEPDDAPSLTSSGREGNAQESGVRIDEDYLRPAAGVLKPQGLSILIDTEYDARAAGAQFHDIDLITFPGRPSSALQSMDHIMAVDNSHITTWMTHGTVWSHCRSIRDVSVDTILALRLASLLQQFGSDSPPPTKGSQLGGPHEQFMNWMWDPWANSKPLNRPQRVSKPASSMILDAQSLLYFQSDHGG